MAKDAVAIGCKLPHGIVLEHPLDSSKTVTLTGLNNATIIGAGYALNAVDADFWEQWVAVNAEFPALVSGAIFVAKNANDAAAIAKEFKDRKTGFEAMNPSSNGVKPAEKD